jgi:hypothetical protein
MLELEKNNVNVVDDDNNKLSSFDMVFREVLQMYDMKEEIERGNV